MLSQQTWVFWPMLPSTRLAEASAGIWPETKIWPLARMAWDCKRFVLGSMCLGICIDVVVFEWLGSIV
jgi:hypothetical protein